MHLIILSYDCRVDTAQHNRSVWAASQLVTRPTRLVTLELEFELDASVNASHPTDVR